MPGRRSSCAREQEAALHLWSVQGTCGLARLSASSANMKPRWAHTGVLATAFLAVFSTLGDSAGAKSGTRRTRIILPCDPSGADYAAADAELKAIDAAINRLAPADDFTPLVSRITKLVETKCFELLGEISLGPASSLSLQTYWNEGGHAHLRGYLDLRADALRLVWVAPSLRSALTLETAPRSPLRSLLCPAADETCAADTRGWEIRAEAAFRHAGELAAARKKLQGRDEPGQLTLSGEEDCETLAIKAPVGRRFVKFRDCLEETLDKHPALPIGHLRAPTRGWLLVSGRRGHYRYCDEMRAYDLASGAAYRVGTCSELALVSGGAVDHRATDEGRRRVVELGRLPVEALREAAWMLLLLDEVDQNVRTRGWGRSVPEGIGIMARASDEYALHGFGTSFTTTSADTTLHWRVVDGDRELKAGTLTWPMEWNEPARAHALTLLKVAEAGFILGCPQTAPPLALVRGRTTISGNLLDSDQPSLDEAVRQIADAWQEGVARQRACRRHPESPR